VRQADQLVTVVVNHLAHPRSKRPGAPPKRGCVRPRPIRHRGMPPRARTAGPASLGPL